MQVITSKRDLRSVSGGSESVATATATATNTSTVSGSGTVYQFSSSYSKEVVINGVVVNLP